jgi:DNA modification methylase
MMDPFLGIGHSAIAARQCGVGRFIGFEIDPDYVQVARNALEKGFTEPTAELSKYIASARNKGIQDQESLL